MRAVVQRVSRAELSVAGRRVDGFEGEGLVVLLGVTHDDGPDEIGWTARKIADLRALHDERSVREASAPVLVVSQFTLYGDARRGRRPTWSAAAPRAVAEPAYDAVCAELTALGVDCRRGVFGADMSLSLDNDGPWTVLLERGSSSHGEA